MEFKKGTWNLDELEIQEWLDKKQKGFMKCDVETLKSKLEEEINSKKEFEPSGQAVISINNLLKIISDKFGFEEKKKENKN